VAVWWSSGPLLERILGKWRLLYLYVFTGLASLFAYDALHYFYPDTFSVFQNRSAARHAIIACISAPLGIQLAVQGVKKTLTSWNLWSRIASVGFMYVVAVALAQGRAQIGIDVGGIAVDLVGG